MIICDLKDPDSRHPREVNSSVFFSRHWIVRRFKDQPKGVLHVHRELACPVATQLVAPCGRKSADISQHVGRPQFHQPLADLLGLLRSPGPVRLAFGTACFLKLR
jgi:hypothetical protein